jgi:hypothetical protein
MILLLGIVEKQKQSSRHLAGNGLTGMHMASHFAGTPANC